MRVIYSVIGLQTSHCLFCAVYISVVILVQYFVCIALMIN